MCIYYNYKRLYKAPYKSNYKYYYYYLLPEQKVTILCSNHYVDGPRRYIFYFLFFIFQVRDRFVNDHAFDGITVESERIRLFKEFITSLEVSTVRYVMDDLLGA